MDEIYKRIQELSDEHLRLCTAFIVALNENKPAEDLAILKHRIKDILNEIDVLENQRNSNATLD